MVERACQRQVFRIEYPDSVRPRLQTTFGEFDVLNCSEAGLCFSLNGGERPTVSRSVQGCLQFNHGETVELAGFLLRVTDDHVALRFSRSISPTFIMKEQRWLRDHARQTQCPAGN